MRGNTTFKTKRNEHGHHFGSLEYKVKVHALDHDKGLDVQRSTLQQTIQAIREDLNTLEQLQGELDKQAGHG